MRKFLRRFAGPKIWTVKGTDPAAITQYFNLVRPVACTKELRRIGPAGDGGYLLPDDLENIAACISPGVDVECRFDLELAQLGIPVYMADASVSGPVIEHPNFHFYPKFLDVVDTDQTMRLGNLVAQAPANGDLVLQMDIEGAEYRVLLDTAPETLNRFRIMVIEFHQLDEMFGRHGFEIISAVFRKLTANHDIVHIHPNNDARPVSRFGYDVPPVLEFTFYRGERNAGAASQASLSFPHPLDADNVASRAHFALPDCWWR